MAVRNIQAAFLKESVMAKQMHRPNIDAPLWAAVRQGGKEAAQIIPALPGSVRVVEEPGTLGNPTPQMITEESGTMRERTSFFDRYDSRSADHTNGHDRDIEIDR
jgi:hypothetical protein